MANEPDPKSGFRDPAEWLRAVMAVSQGGAPDPRLGPPVDPGPPLTDAELDEIEARLGGLINPPDAEE